ncbi:ArnT family glycosyltransferase [Massilia horti]|uniref:Glycosyltransferase family 39 protein n=1 Tax=Massilia horti TaxID=2562153 RepID=A0A4Y9T2W0_9BURK|nr:glycosyltransferase family 39 protein [Massilia horti]TFW31846.1 glycosyltransferase family 39 protein [Massilia horti]
MRKTLPLQRVSSARELWPGARAALAAAAPLLLLAAAVYLGLFYELGGPPLFDVDEGAFSEATREMLQRGDFVTTWLNGQLRFDKPILVYWLQALSVTLFGVNEFAFRLPSALAGLGWIAAIHAFARAQYGRATGYAAALIAATTLGLCVIARGAIADALLNLFLALTMFDIYRYLVQPRVRYRNRAYLWIGLGLLTKGPVAILVPFAASGIAYALHGQWRRWRRAVFDPAGWLILGAVAGPWYVLEYLREGDAFIAGFFMRHNVERFMGPLQGHGGKFFYYVPVVLLMLLPYTGLLLRTLPGLLRLRSRPLDTFLWCWFLFVFLFFSFSGTKLPHYLMYGITPLFLLMASHRQQLASRWLAFTPPVLLLAIVVALPHALQRAAPALRDQYFRDMFARADVFGPLWRLAAVCLLLAGLALALWPRARIWPRLLASGFLCSFAVVGLVLPAAAELQQGPVKEAAQLVRSARLPVRTWQFNVPSFSVYRQAVTKPATTLHPGELILTRSDKLAGMGPAEVVYRKGGVVLARIPM